MASELTPQPKAEKVASASDAGNSVGRAHDSLAAQAWHWTDNNVVRPAANSLLIEPYSAVRNAVNTVATPFTDKLLPKLDHLHVAKPTNKAGEIAQTLTGGILGAAVLTGISFLGRGTLGGATRLAGSLGVDTELAGALAARPLIADLGAISSYEAIRDPNLQRGETRLSNTLGTVAAVGGFRAASEFAAGMPGMTQIGSRFFAGGAGMMSGTAVGDLAQGKTPTSDELWNAGLYGGVLGMAMPQWTAKSSISNDVQVPRQARPAGAFASALEPLPLAETAASETSKLDATRSLSQPRSERTSLTVGDNSATPFADYADFHNRGIILYRAPMKVYDIKTQPGTSIAFEDSAPNYPRISPQHALGMLEDLPDMRLIKRLSVFDDPHNQEPWLRQTEGADYRVHGEMMDDGEMRLYRPALNEDVPTTVRHEWNHALKSKSPIISRRFDQVGDLESLRTISNTVGSTLPDEQWSILGEGLLSKDPVVAPATARSNPIRSTLWAEAVKARLNDLPSAQRGTSDAFYRTLIDYIENKVRPIAIDNLTSAARGTDVSAAARARDILLSLQGSQ